MAATDISNTICAKPATPVQDALCGTAILGGIAPGIICAITGNCGNDAVGGVTTPPPDQKQTQPLQQSSNNNLLLYGGLGLGGILLLVVLLKVL